MKCGVKIEDYRTMKKALDRGRMNDNLRLALKDTIKAIDAENCELAFELSAVKSYIVGSLKEDPHDKKFFGFSHRFREDEKYNEKVIGKSLYSLLDNVHHDIAYDLPGSPISSGTVIFTASGAYEKPKAKIKHPVISMMEQEHRETVRWSKRRD